MYILEKSFSSEIFVEAPPPRKICENEHVPCLYKRGKVYCASL